MSNLSRREFIRTSSLTVLAASLAACSKDPSPSASPTATNGDGGTLDDVIAGRAQTLTYISVGTELLSGASERLAFGIVDSAAQQLVREATGRVWFAATREETAEGPFEIAFFGEGLPEDRGFFAADVTFPADGQFLVLAEIDRGQGLEIAAGNVQVGRRNGMPIAGEAAPKAQTPTTDAARGVDPICTAQPPCGMHARSLKDVLAAGDKAIVMIATPAYCTSRLCGPEIEILDQLRTDEVGEGIEFVHIELLANDEPDTIKLTSPLSPAAIAFGTSEEPAFYAIGTDGVIIERILGPGDVATFRDALERLQDA